MYSSNSPRNLRIAFLIGQAAPSARPQIVVPGMMPIVSPISSSRSRSLQPPLAGLDALEHRQRPARAFAAGRALAAAFVGEEAATVVQEVDHRHGFVHHDDGRRAQAQAADLARAGEIERRVELGLGQQAHADAAGDRGLGLAALPHAAAVLVDQLAGR